MLITADMMPGVNKMMLITEIYELKRVCECVPGCNPESHSGINFLKMKLCTLYTM